MEIHRIHYRNIYWNESELSKVVKEIKRFAKLGYSDCQIEINIEGVEEPRCIDEGAFGFDYCTQIHKVFKNGR